MGFFEERLYPITEKVVAAEAETPHIKEIVAGTLPIEKFKFQVRQNYNYLIEYARAWAIGLAKCPDYETMAVWYEYVKETVEHEIPFYREYWKKNLDISFEELDGEVMSNIKRSYTSHELARSWEGDLTEQVTALLPCDILYWELAKVNIKRCNLPKGNIYRDWIEFYTTGWFKEVCEKLITLINRLTENKSERQLAKLEEIYAVGCNYEYMSWDMYYNMKTWPFEDIFPKKFTMIKD
jgi:thiaminase/transcriptional activator TenA